MLTEVHIKGLKPKGSPYIVSDGNGTGLRVRVQVNGSKLFQMKYTSPDGRVRNASFGEWKDGAKDGISLKVAREKATAYRHKLARGVDPMAEKEAERAAEIRFADVFPQWFDSRTGAWSERHAGYVRRRYDADIKPYLGSVPVAKVTRLMVRDCVVSIEDRAPEMADRALSTIRQVLEYATNHGIIEANPVAGLRPGAILAERKERNFSRVSDADLPALLRALDSLPGTGTVKLGARLLALTMLRTRELTELRWSEVQGLDNGEPLLKIGGERMKKDIPFVQPLSKQSAELLRALRALNGHSEYVFPSDRDDTKPINSVSILRAIERAGYKGKQTGHGFRGIGATLMAENGTPDRVIDACLAHTRKGVIGVYVKDQQIAEKRIALQWLADHYDSLAATPAAD